MNLHIVLYAKGHYAKSDDVMEDLKYIQKVYSSLPLEHDCLSNHAMLDIVARIYGQLVMTSRPQDFADLIRYMFWSLRGDRSTTTLVECIEPMLGGLANTRVVDIPPLPKRDPKYQPPITPPHKVIK